MKFHELNVSRGKSSKRVGRGISAGQGKTAGRGTKGYGARTGAKKRPGFAGGQNPLMQQLPKLPGFRSLKAKAENVYTGQLNRLTVKVIDSEVLAEAGFVSSAYVNIKLISKGELTKKLTVKLPAASESAIAAIQSAGGTFEAVPRRGRPVTSTKEANKKA